MKYFYWATAERFYVRVIRTSKGTITRKFALREDGAFINLGFVEFRSGDDPSEKPKFFNIREMAPKEIAALRLQHNELLEDDKKYKCA